MNRRREALTFPQPSEMRYKRLYQCEWVKPKPTLKQRKLEKFRSFRLVDLINIIRNQVSGEDVEELLVRTADLTARDITTLSEVIVLAKQDVRIVMLINQYAFIKKEYL